MIICDKCKQQINNYFELQSEVPEKTRPEIEVWVDSAKYNLCKECYKKLNRYAADLFKAWLEKGEKGFMVYFGDCLDIQSFMSGSSLPPRNPEVLANKIGEKD